MVYGIRDHNVYFFLDIYDIASDGSLRTFQKMDYGLYIFECCPVLPMW